MSSTEAVVVSKLVVKINWINIREYCPVSEVWGRDRWSDKFEKSQVQIIQHFLPSSISHYLRYGSSSLCYRRGMGVCRSVIIVVLGTLLWFMFWRPCFGKWYSGSVSTSENQWSSYDIKYEVRKITYVFQIIVLSSVRILRPEMMTSCSVTLVFI